MRVVLGVMLCLVNIGICAATHLEIYVPAEAARHFDISIRKDLSFFDAFFKFDDTEFHLFEFQANNKRGSELSGLHIQDIEKLKFIFMDTSHVTVIDDKNIISNFVNYLKFGRKHPSFNCIDFCTNLMNSFLSNNVNPWKMVPAKEEELDVLDVIAISHADESLKNKLGTFAHFALYIGNGKYLSVYGTLGGVYVATFEQMRAYWKGGTLLRNYGNEAFQ